MKYIFVFLCALDFSFSFGQKRIDVSFDFDGKAREAIVSMPTKQPPSAGWPIVFMLHGTSGDASVFYDAKGWKELGQAENFITVFPSSLKWCFIDDGIVKFNTKFTCGDLLDSICPQQIPDLIDDIRFFRKLVSNLVDTVKIDTNKIFLNGFSNGSVMSHKVGLSANDLFKATAGSSGPLFSSDSIIPSHRVPIWFVLGTKDDRYFSTYFPTKLPFNDSILVYLAKSLNSALACQGLSQKFSKFENSTNITYSWTECLPGIKCGPYLFSLNKGQTHQFPNGNNFPFNAPKLFWEFFNNPPKTTLSSSLVESSVKRRLRVAPNPAIDRITILGIPDQEEVLIFSVDGSVVLKQRGSTVEIQSLPNGLYFVKTSQQTGYFVITH